MGKTVRLGELYPYWDNAHGELLDAVELLTEEQLDAKPQETARSIRQILLHLLYEERYWIAHLAGGYVLEPPKVGGEDAKSLADALAVAREVTARVLEPFSSPGLRAVRTVPADPESNRLETNVSVAWLFWHLLETELVCWGQIAQRIDDTRPTKSRWR